MLSAQNVPMCITKYAACTEIKVRYWHKTHFKLTKGFEIGRNAISKHQQGFEIARKTTSNRQNGFECLKLLKRPFQIDKRGLKLTERVLRSKASGFFSKGGFGQGRGYTPPTPSLWECVLHF